MVELPPQVQVLPATPQLKGLMTIIRSKDTPRADFIFYADRIIRLLVEEGMCLPMYLNMVPIASVIFITVYFRSQPSSCR